MRLIIAKDYADVSRKAANIIAAQVHLKPDCVLGLAPGSILQLHPDFTLVADEAALELVKDLL